MTTDVRNILFCIMKWALSIADVELYYEMGTVYSRCKVVL